ncbi:MAG: glycosyltransferase [Flavitalea sp.]
MRHPRLYFTVTNDLSYDQRMIRICNSLAENGYEVVLVGRKTYGSIPLLHTPFIQKRLDGFFNSGFLFYAEFNIRLFFFLLFKKMDGICAIDLDTILPCYLISKLKRVPRVYDAHELFCEMKEIAGRPFIHKCWKRIEQLMVPCFKKGYTVNSLIAEEFYKMYRVRYAVIRNMPVLSPIESLTKQEIYILYQGAVNEGRCFETLIPAMQHVNAKLIICGDGNFMQQTKELVQKYGVADRVIFKGKISPTELKNQTLGAFAGVTLFENNGQSNFLSLGNRFFDYMQAGLPQLCVGYPLYKQINDQYGFALLIDDPGMEQIAAGLNKLLSDELLYESLRKNALLARKELNWNNEERILVEFYREIFIK